MVLASTGRIGKSAEAFLNRETFTLPLRKNKNSAGLQRPCAILANGDGLSFVCHPTDITIAGIIYDDWGGVAVS